MTWKEYDICGTFLTKLFEGSQGSKFQIHAKGK